MTPDFKITANDADITDAIKQRLISLSVTDHSGGESDTATITLDDRPPSISLPPTRAELKISIGYVSGKLADMGLFIVDEIALSGPPSTLVISAKGANFSDGDSSKKGIKNSLKSTKTRPWDDVTISDIVETIANDSGYTARVGSQFADTKIIHIDQSSESDMHFLTRVAKQYGALFKPAGGFLSFVSRGEGKSGSGKSLPSLSLSPNDITTWNVTLVDRPKYEAVGAMYHDNDTGKRVTVGGGKDKTVKVQTKIYPTKEEAEAAVKAKEKDLEEEKDTCSITMPGNPNVFAESPVTLSGFRDGVNAEWIADSVTQNIDSTSAFATSIELKKKMA